MEKKNEKLQALEEEKLILERELEVQRNLLLEISNHDSPLTRAVEEIKSLNEELTLSKIETTSLYLNINKREHQLEASLEQIVAMREKFSISESEADDLGAAYRRQQTLQFEQVGYIGYNTIPLHSPFFSSKGISIFHPQHVVVTESYQ